MVLTTLVKLPGKLLTRHRVKQAGSSCVGSPNEINAYFREMVEDVVDIQANDQTEDLELGPTHDGVYLVAWNKVDTNK